MPWAWTRREIAKAWQCFPWQVDEAPWGEVLQELKLRNIEADAQEFWRNNPYQQH